VDNGTEFTSKALGEWAYRRGIKLDYTRLGKPTEIGLIESINGRLRDEFLNAKELVTLHDAREKLKAWQHDFNHHRPHGSLGHLTPSEFVSRRSVQPNKNGQPVGENCPVSGGTSSSSLLGLRLVHLPGVWTRALNP